MLDKGQAIRLDAAHDLATRELYSVRGLAGALLRVGDQFRAVDKRIPDSGGECNLTGKNQSLQVALPLLRIICSVSVEFIGSSPRVLTTAV
jgi:hypothetical protein